MQNSPNFEILRGIFELTGGDSSVTLRPGEAAHRLGRNVFEVAGAMGVLARLGYLDAVDGRAVRLTDRGAEWVTRSRAAAPVRPGAGPRPEGGPPASLAPEIPVVAEPTA